MQQQDCDEYGRLAIAKTMPNRRNSGSPVALPCDTLRRKHSLSPRLPLRNYSDDSFFNSNDCFSLPEDENSQDDDYSSASSTHVGAAPMTNIVCSPRNQSTLEEGDDITASDISSHVSSVGDYDKEERWNTPNRELINPTTAPRRLPSLSRPRLVVRAHSCSATSQRLHLRRDCFPIKPMRLRSTSQVTHRRPMSFSGILAERSMENRTNK
ncbi:hypothetical protein FisN_2Hh051 [Fistulifera solaris]|jgi:hypothetical protein|uniref:Uncharacterized protein n=1 Tax=Fistulifera solaris TaxID=1519565 RepID=A0A1Z5KDS4_FISSO|nr:hypothetical protein FisN_2Hh051 [Fistulifera solaris]|eukprot:GAX24460.1 hypothetical protein FisN_2Hh051 [Fistulifera solaris]